MGHKSIAELQSGSMSYRLRRWSPPIGSWDTNRSHEFSQEARMSMIGEFAIEGNITSLIVHKRHYHMDVIVAIGGSTVASYPGLKQGHALLLFLVHDLGVR